MVFILNKASLVFP